MRKPEFGLCKNKGADQLCSNCTADQCLCFRYKDSAMPHLLISKISSFKPLSVTVQADLSNLSVTVQADLCWTWSENPEDRFSRVAA